MSTGLLATFLILIFVNHEISFDKFHSKSHRIYRLITAKDDKAGAIVALQMG